MQYIGGEANPYRLHHGLCRMAVDESGVPGERSDWLPIVTPDWECMFDEAGSTIRQLGLGRAKTPWKRNGQWT